MSKRLSTVFLDTDKKIWEGGIEDAKAKISQLRRSIRVFRENIRNRVSVPKRLEQTKAN